MLTTWTISLIFTLFTLYRKSFTFVRLKFDDSYMEVITFLSCVSTLVLSMLLIACICVYNINSAKLNKYKLGLDYNKAFNYISSTVADTKYNYKEIVELKADNDTFLFDATVPDSIDEVYNAYRTELDQIKLLGGEE